MKLEKYSPTFRNILISKAKEQKTEKGIILPSSVDNHTLRVEKVGKDCIETKANDIIILMAGIVPQPVNIESQDRDYATVMEQQVVGISRE